VPDAHPKSINLLCDIDAEATYALK
jgi:hypothetical protein